jgi:tetraacyldisaccharide 4'-kinase
VRGPKDRPWLAPLGALYGALAATRTGLYQRGLFSRARLAGAVISVGNLSLGGAGKTPVVERLARSLMEEGFPVSILSRGYGGSFAGEALLVSDGQRVLADAAEAGDEPVMLARALPGVVVAVGPRRDAVGRFVEARFGPRVHVLDDGFQHLRLERDLDILCLDGSSHRPMPAGRLREWPGAAARADLVLLAEDTPAPSTLDPARTFQMRRRIEGFATRDGVAHTAPVRPFLLAGVARPERFEADARAQSPELAGTLFFQDHHPYSPEELRGALDRARSLGADALVTTAKDEVRLPDVSSDLPILVLRISAGIEDEVRFRSLVLARVRERFGRAGGERP